MNPAELRAELEAGSVRATYLVAGEEALLRDDAFAAIRGAVLEGAADDFNFDRLDGEKTGPDVLLAAVRTLPVMARRRLVVLREPDAQRAAAGLGDAIAEAAAELAGASEPGTVLVVVAGKVDRRSRWARAIGDAGLVRCDPPRRARELAAFAREEAGRQGVRFERGALELLVERTGSQLLMLRQEIAKASLFARPGEAVTRAQVLAGSTDLAEESIWELTDAIGEGRRADALACLAKLLRAGAPPPALLGTLVSHFRKLLRVRHGGAVAAPPFVLRKLEGQAGRYTPGRLISCLRAIHDTDTALKGEGALRPDAALERLVIGLAS